MLINLYQICYTQEQMQNAHHDGVIPYDNLENKNPELREFPIFEKEYWKRVMPPAMQAHMPNEYWGFISPKFVEKTNITVSNFRWWMSTIGDADVCFINPCPIMEVLFDNVVAHGEVWHPGISKLINQTLIKIGYSVPDLAKLNLMSNQTFAMCNYFVGNMKFWNAYITFVNEFLQTCEVDMELSQMLYGPSNYNLDKSLSLYPFVIERLFSVFLVLHPSIKAKHYNYNAQEQSNKMTAEQFLDLQVISTIKESAVKYSDSDLVKMYKILQYKFNQRNPELFNKE